MQILNNLTNFKNNAITTKKLTTLVSMETQSPATSIILHQQQLPYCDVHTRELEEQRSQQQRLKLHCTKFHCYINRTHLNP